MKKEVRKHQSGQALLVVLMVLVVAITVGLSVLSQSITDVKISSEEEESAQAFNVAEIGIESILKDIQVGTGIEWTGDDGQSYNVDVTQEGASGYLTGQPVSQGDVIQLLVNGDENLNIYWQDEAALELIVVQDVAGQYQIDRLALDGQSRDNGFDSPTSGTFSHEGQSFSYQLELDIASNYDRAQFVRVRPLYDDSYIYVSGTNMEDQYYQITSTGQTSSGVTRKIEVTRDIYPSLPSVFDYALFSGSSIVK